MDRKELEITIACFYWGNWCGTMGLEYINRLYRGVSRHLDLPFRFVCFTDIAHPSNLWLMEKGIEFRVLDCPLWKWNLRKMYAYSPDNGLTGRVLVFDLDVIITGDLTDIVTASDEFITCCGAYRTEDMGGSLMSFMAGYGADFLWKEMVENSAHWEWRTNGSERKYFNLLFNQYNRPWHSWEERLPWQVASYKRDCQHGLRPEARVVRFHGHPRPHEVHNDSINQRWVKEYWA